SENQQFTITPLVFCPKLASFDALSCQENSPTLTSTQAANSALARRFPLLFPHQDLASPLFRQRSRFLVHRFAEAFDESVFLRLRAAGVSRRARTNFCLSGGN